MNGIKGYISIREASYRWGVSERRGNQYCAEGRIPGASRFGRSWAIPENAEKPSDPRFQEQHRNSGRASAWRIPLCIWSTRKKEVNAMTCDETFYHRYLNGDDAGLEALMKKYGNPLTLYIDGYLHDVHEAEDLMLDVFAYLFTKKPRIRDGGFKAYLYKTARNMALRHKSKRKCLFRLDELTDESDGQLLVEEVIRTEERNRILHLCMGEMNPDYREVLYLTYFEGMSYAQAAEVTGKTVKQITNMVYRGKESLRRLLEREGITNAES